MVHWPEPNMPTVVGPPFSSAALHFCAITSQVSSHETWVKSPFLSYLPFFLRRSGCVSRSWPYMIFERKYPLTQLRPRLTSACVSPCVATTRPSFVATITPQPVPQKRQGALFHFSSVIDRSVTRFCAASGAGSPPAAAANAAASNFRNSRRSRGFFFIAGLLFAWSVQPSVPWNTSDAVNTCGREEMTLRVPPPLPVSAASITTTSFPFGSRL